MIGLKRHAQFFTALLIGAGLYALCWALPGGMRAMVGINGFFATYLVLMLILSAQLTPETLETHAEEEDEGAALILVLALIAVGVSLGSIFLALNDKTTPVWVSLFALASVPLGWATLQIMAGFRYAHLYFVDEPDGGLDFPGKDKPGAWDFLYFSFTIGMTAQVSDVQVTRPRMRKLVLFHGVGSFFYNTVILALAVNAALNLGN